MRKVHTKRVGLLGVVLCVAFAVCLLTGTAFLPTSAFAAATEDDTLLKTYTSEAGLVNAPTVVLDAESQATLDCLVAEPRKPSNAIVRVNADMDVTDKTGASLGKFADVYKTVLKPNNVIPVLRVDNEASADAVIAFLRDEMNLLDLAVLSQDPALVQKIRTENERVRGIVAYPERENPAQADLYDIVRTTNESFANVAVVPQSMASAQNVRYIQARFKTVWVAADSTAAFDIYDCVGSGAYGIIAADPSAVYDVLEQYGEGDLVRTPFNVGHRGLPGMYNENSVSGVQAAVKLGATHVELDAYVTTDGHIVMMHNATLDATTNGKGSIEKLSLEELRQYRLTEITDEQIPTLPDILEVLKDTDVILVFEIKSTKVELFTALEAALDEYDFWDRIVVISFHESMLRQMKRALPQIPTASLNHADEDTFLTQLKNMGEWNAGVDTDYGTNDRAFNEQYLRDRGFVGWYWTYGDERGMKTATKEGFVGLTTNDAAAYADKIMLIEGKTVYNVSSLAAGDTVQLTATDYRGNRTEAAGKVFAVEDCGPYFRVVARYGDRNYAFYTQSFAVYKGDAPGTNASATKKGCKSTLKTVTSGVAGLLLICGACFLLGKKKGGAVTP